MVSTIQKSAFLKFYDAYGKVTKDLSRVEPSSIAQDELRVITASDLHLLTTEEVSHLKSKINIKVEEANKHHYAINVKGLSSKLQDYINSTSDRTCNHMMYSCNRECRSAYSPVFEILYYLQAAVSSTKKHKRSDPSFDFEIS